MRARKIAEIEVEFPTKRARYEGAFRSLFPAILAADSLVLKSGETITGTYAGGDARSIRFVVGDQVKTFPVENVTRIVF